MRSSRGMGAINPSKMPNGKRKARLDSTDFTEYADGGKVGSKGAPTKADFIKSAKTAKKK